MEIKVNEFVRTKNGTIRKIAETLNNIVIADKPYYESYCETEAISKRDIVKHSKNIIDLIEEGDYVNGHKVVNEIYGEDDNELYFEIEGGFNKAKYIGEKDIKSVLTKEQFSSLEYII